MEVTGVVLWSAGQLCRTDEGIYGDDVLYQVGS
jgi:hypothetical protein